MEQICAGHKEPSTAVSPDFATSVTVVDHADWDPNTTYFDIEFGNFYDLKPGDIVTATDGTTIKQRTVTDVTITDGDPISGTTQPGSVVEGNGCDANGCARRRVIADSGGNWIADFSIPGQSEDEQVLLNIQSGMGVDAQQWDDDSDWTQYDWKLPPNEPPQITALLVSVDPIQIGQTITAIVTFSDSDVGDTHTVFWDWGDGTTTTLPATPPTTSAFYNYALPGVYTVTVTITDVAGESAQATYQFIVIYDPNGGFVAGGGWINSPAGANTLNPSLAGKATFGFVSKYQKGAKVPTGNTEFQFHVAGMNFKSTSYDWLVIAGARAQYKGTGTINGAGEYGFLLTAIDGTPDKFRIKIWDKSTGEVIYDNQLGENDNANPSTVIQGGSIVIYKAK